MEEKNNTKTAAITGAASGIGEAYAKKLGSLGYNLILIDKDKEGLKKVSLDIKKEHNVVIGMLPADLSKEKDIEQAAKKIGEQNITLLVNNAGFGIAKTFAETPDELLDDMVRVHVNTAVRFTRAVLPGMIKRNEGTIINVSSIAVYFKSRERNVTYGSTKSFLISFSEMLQEEMKHQKYKIKIQALCPGFTRTNFMNTPHVKGRDYSRVPEWMWMTPDAVVEESLKNLKKKKTVIIPGRINKLLVFLMKTKVLSWIPEKRME
ncbi:MAG: SDR family NAD(P)-dependent oxidoreductase [Candidatus Nanoarchaeia archaeon]